MGAYQVKLPVFEGPFDLLYHLIEEQQIDIYDIPIAKITEQYLEQIQMMEILDMEIASEFLVMAATLIEIKSKMLLPKEKTQEFESGDEFIDEGYQEEDARAQLVEQLLEYKKFKLLAQELRKMEGAASRIYTRTYDIERQPEEILEINIGPVELLDIYHTIVRRRLMPPIHRVVLNKLSIIDRMKEIRDMLKKFKGEITFARLLKKDNSRYETVLSFMAILEMIKDGEIGCSQDGNFKPILIIPQNKKSKSKSKTQVNDEEDQPDDVSKMPLAKTIKRSDDDIRSIKIKDIPEEMLRFKTPSEIAAEKAAAEAQALAESVPVTPDLEIVSESNGEDSNIPTNES
ncbi:MAG: segregation/condensation protein A [Candidatus Riflebacteria bacterium]|nr:segregation/condensation protein A [Candidatus Riflebacteria bacterium]